ncbi:drug/metabolite transporter EamA [Massilia sp. WF1]|uniref:DMT family transporter n=1 Tax=unclassified Massilia TaxID=2609279 RepID=UPI00064A613C|nr:MULTISPECIES: EamA family transporter [unclassified Massilia]ALK98964.1 drug/metabolite transporter EamA [Massilia sp. WG5]KLU38488.1 drug/metabolite transporter EamA [Massilia sp. WF1]
MPSYVLFTIASLIWGSTFWAITLQLGDIPPAVSVVYRFALASGALFAWCLVRGDGLHLSWRTQKWTLLQGFLTFGLSYVCTYNSEQYVVSALVAVLFALMVFWTPLLSRFVFGTPVPRKTWTAGVGAMAGVTLLFWHSIQGALHDLGQGGQGHFLLGLGLGIGASIASAAGSIVVGKVREQSSNLILTTAWSMFWGTCMVALWCLASGQQFVLPHTTSYVLGLLHLAVFGSVVAFICYFTLINRIGSAKAVYIGVITPVLSVLMSIKLEHYRPGPVEWLGMAVCLGSVAWAMYTPKRKSPTLNLNDALDAPLETP